MKNMFISWQTLKLYTFDQAKKALLDAAKTAGDVTLRDLVLLGKHQERWNNGVYFFWKDGQPVYIGSAGSRSFVERVPAHFDPRPDAWFATLIKALRENPLQQGRDPHEQAFELRLSLLVCERDSANGPNPLDLESFFLASLESKLNKSRWNYVPDSTITLEQELVGWQERRQKRAVGRRRG